jgi:amidase
MTDLHYLSATEAIARFRARTLSPVDVITALIERRAAVDPEIRAFTYTFDDQALAAARAAEARYAAGTARALEGVAVAIKDLHAIEGHVTTHGSLVFRDNRDETTLVTIQRLLDAGAIVVGRSTASEFGCSNVTQSRLWGITRNPWNLAYTAGGSSGGAGAALAAGLTTLADGSDYGGSIRIPAACCGVVGYKPPHGRNPTDAGASLDPFSHFGPMARTVADAALMQNVMSGPSDRDLATLPDRVDLPAQLEGIAGFRVAYSLDLGYVSLDPEVRAAVLAALELLRDLGCTIDPVELGWTDRVLDAFELHHAASDAAALSVLWPSQRDLLTDYVCAQIERGNAVTARELFAVHDVRAEMYQTLGPILARYDLFVCPTNAVPAVPADHTPSAPLRIADRAVPGHRGWVMTYPFNMLGALPVLSVPIARARNGVPIGLQIVARPHDDLRVFRGGAALERARGPWFTTPAHQPHAATRRAEPRPCSELPLKMNSVFSQPPANILLPRGCHTGTNP